MKEKSIYRLGDKVKVYGHCSSYDYHDGDIAYIVDFDPMDDEYIGIRFKNYKEVDWVHAKQIRKVKCIQNQANMARKN